MKRRASRVIPTMSVAKRKDLKMRCTWRLRRIPGSFAIPSTALMACFATQDDIA